MIKPVRLIDLRLAPAGAHVAAALLLSFLACSDAPGAHDAVANDGSRPWASRDSWLEARLEAVSDASLNLGEVLDLAVGHQDMVYVLDALSPGVVVLDSLLSPVTTVGRRGEEPGEFMFIRNVQVLPGDSLMVFDGQLKRVTVLSEAPEAPEAQYDSMRFAVVPADVSQLWRMLGPVGNYLAYDRRTFYAGDIAEADAARNDVFFALGDDGLTKRHDSVLVVPSLETLVARSSGAVALGRHPYGREGFVGMLTNGGFAYVNSDALSVAIFDDEGQQIRSFSYPTVPLPVSSQDLAAELDKLRPALARVLREGAPYTRPPLVGMVVDDQDRIWLGLRGPAEDMPWEWAAFELDGRHVGSVRLPAGLLLRAATGGKLLGVVVDDLEVPRIHLYRTVGTAAS